MFVSANTIVCSVYDDKAKFHPTPFFSQHDEVAIRDFVDIVENPKSPFGKNRNDYSLVSIGTFNADTGILVAHEPKTIFHGSNIS